MCKNAGRMINSADPYQRVPIKVYIVCEEVLAKYLGVFKDFNFTFGQSLVDGASGRS